MAQLANPATLGVFLLALSATLFAVDLGGTYALDARRHTEAPGVALITIAPPAARTAVQAQIPPLGPQATAASQSVPAGSVRPFPRAAASNSHRRTTTARNGSARGSMRVRVAEKAAPQALPARHASKPPALAVAPSRPARIRATTVRSHTSPFDPPARTEADLRDVRRFVMAKLNGEHHGLSVISAATYPSGKTVLVTMTVRDGPREWFEKDLVYRNGTDLSIEAENRRTLPHVAPLKIARNG